MNPTPERLRQLEDEKLIDLARNNRSYGFTAETRNTALRILKERGLDIDHLKRTGALTNHAFVRAEAVYFTFMRNSRFALWCYFVAVACLISEGTLDTSSGTLGVIAVLFYLACITFILLAFVGQNEFYTVIGKPELADGLWSYILVGVPLYFMIFRYIRAQMREAMQMVQS